MVLVGEKTRYLYKFVRWEIEQALALKLPTIVVNLNGLRQQDRDRCPSLLSDALAVHVSFNARIMQHALETWPAYHEQLTRTGRNGPFFYEVAEYSRLGL